MFYTSVPDHKDCDPHAVDQFGQVEGCTRRERLLGLSSHGVLVFRTSVPGHRDCDLHPSVYARYGEY